MKKILLLHGWNYANYKNVADNPNENPWLNRQKFIDLLQGSDFELITPSFPGFVGYEGGEPEKAWSMTEYVNYCNNLVEQYKPDVILGYSFGGAVATLWKSTLGLNNQIKVILISPALERQYEKANTVNVLRLKNLIPRFLLNLVRGLYLRFIVKNPYYINGTKFLRNSYLSIVTVKCGAELNKIKPEQLLIIFVENDTATPPGLLKNVIADNHVLLNRITIISGGRHDIANTYTKDLAEIIKKFIL